MGKIVVGPNLQSTHDISLNAGGRVYGFSLDGGPKGLVEGASIATSILSNRQGSRFGNHDPNFAHIEQRTWLGGRGQENMSDDPSRFFDSKDCWTLSPNVLLPTLQWRFAKTLRKNYQAIPGNVKWKPLDGSQSYLARSFTTTATMDARELYMWLKKVGNPGDVKAGIYPDSTGAPNMAAPIREQTIFASTISDVVSFFAEFRFSTSGALSTTTTYWVVVTGLGVSDGRNHWAVGYDDHATGSESANGTAWTVKTTLGIYYRVTEADINQTFIPFVLGGVHYFVSKRANQGTSQVFMNGDRGKVASATSTTLACTGKSWVTDQWKSSSLNYAAMIRIVQGPGAGQEAEIVTNTNDDLEWSPAFDVTPTSDSHFCIYHTEYFTEITSPSVGTVIDVAVANDIAYFARGTETADGYILKFQYKVSDGTHEVQADADDKADLVAIGMQDGVIKLWRAENGPTAAKTVVVSSAPIPAAFADAIVFTADIPCGEKTWMITNLIEFNTNMHVLKEDGIGYIFNSKYVPLSVGMNRVTESTNGKGCAVMDTYLYLNWSHSVERLSGGTIDDEGQWSGAGMPENRNGVMVWLETIVAHMLGAQDAGGTGYSSVMAYNGFGTWTEILRGHNIGKRIRMTHWQENPGGRPFLWTEIGGDLICQVFPKKTLNPMRDSGCKYMHEAVMESSTIDLDVAMLPKFFKSISANTQYLGSDDGFRRLAIEYQMDNEVNTSTWISAREFAYSPEESVDINQGNKQQMRWRIRLLTEVATKPVRVRAIVVAGYAKLPAKRVWTLRIKLSSLSRDALGAPNVDPTELYKWLWQQSAEAGGVFMHSKWENADSAWVVVEPPGLARTMVNTIQQWWGGVATLTLREA